MKDGSNGKFKYFVILHDEYSGYLLVIFMSNKNGVADAVLAIVQDYEKLFNGLIQRLISFKRNSVKWL